MIEHLRIRNVGAAPGGDGTRPVSNPFLARWGHYRELLKEKQMTGES
jgi:hypothetical protein